MLQTQIVPFLKANPYRNYFLAGDNGVGKSLFGYCLVRWAICNGRRIAACNLADLLEEYRALEKPIGPDETVKAPVISASDLRTDKTKWLILLQELDKARPSEYAGEKFFALVDAAHNFHQQLVVTTNCHKDELIQKWDRSGCTYGKSIVRRLVERAVVVNMFAGS